MIQAFTHTSVLKNNILNQRPIDIKKTRAISPSYGKQSESFALYYSFVDMHDSISHFFNLLIEPDVAINAIDADNIIEESQTLDILGNDLLIFLCSTIGIVPLFKYLKASPVLGFLTAGLLMGPAGLGLFEDLADMETLAEFGVLFLLFEQGLELTVDRLKSLSKYAFGMGTLQMLISTLSFFAFPFVGGVKLLEYFFLSRADVVNITRLDEALVIGATLSLSSSAFVLQILKEKGQLATKFGSASLGILLFQDIAVVPLLVLLPILESTESVDASASLALLGMTFVKAIVGLGGILVFGGALVRFLFSLVAQSKSSETFVALCLLVAVGTGELTDALGLSSTLGAFAAGTLLAESNYRTQIEADIKPFRGLLLGLFFLTTGASVDPFVIQQQLPTAIGLLAGLIAFKATIITALGPIFGLSLSESVRTGFILSGGGEFAFVLLTLADKLNVIPNQLAKILVGVVVMSMALTPTLSSLGDKAAAFVDDWEQKNGRKKVLDNMGSSYEGDMENIVVICGFGVVGETVARFLSMSSMMENLIATGGSIEPTKYMAFDLDPDVVVRGSRNGYSVMYGDGSEPLVLQTAGVTAPRALVVTYDDDEICTKSVQRLRYTFPGVPIISRANNRQGLFEVLDAGANRVIPDDREAALSMASSVLESLGADPNDLKELRQDSRGMMELAEEDAYTLMREKRIAAGAAERANSVFSLGARSPLGVAAEALTDMVESANELAAAERDEKTERLTRTTKTVTVPLEIGNRLGLIGSKRTSAIIQVLDDSDNDRNTDDVTDKTLSESKTKRKGVNSDDVILGVTVCMLPDSKGGVAEKNTEDTDNQ
eukprot:CAMPEP_0182421836 /NCGR_PEP_ID=MMETSP1167-20130531/7354_1 /TAXON_ID=2988 /ORGANISM="Mallomonas Sp, Strain CCMP3275" /LENGTH=832 /DNA_ID=CAMNT_0024599371 /DNA_START=104 /DNA_END=2602 /DNA_ORIENTATION=+